MPSHSEKQARTMRAAAHNSRFAKKMQIPPDVAAEYVKADEAEATSEADADGYVRRGPPPKKRGQYALPRSPKKKDR